MARTSILLIALFACSVSAGAQGRGRGAGASQAATPEATVSVSVFTREHERIIRDWFSDPSNLQGLPPGLAKKEQLPPGLQRQLAKNGKLPPGLEKKLQPFPTTLEARLPRLREGWIRVVIGGNVAVIEVSTQTIVDILTDIF